MGEIVQFFIDQYSNDINTGISTDFKKWVHDMSNYNTDSKRILTCIAIDTKNFPDCKNNYLKIFNAIKYKSIEPPQKKIHTCLINNPEFYFFNESTSSSKKNNYTRIVSFIVFIQYFFNEANNHKKTFNIDDKGYISYKNTKRILNKEKYRFLNVKNNQGGTKPNYIVFIGVKEDFDRITQNLEDDNKANICYKEYGLPPKEEGDEFVCLFYPSDFNEKTFQPLTINSDLEQEKNLFLSYKQVDNFGRTRSQIKDYKQNGMQEQIHEKISTEYIYTWEYLGAINSYVKNIDNITAEAIERFNHG